MRVMVLVKATKESEDGVMPTTELFDAMTKFNEELVKAGVMLGGDGLKPSSHGKRVAFDGPSRRVIDGPFAETRELVAGYWVWEVRNGQSDAPIRCQDRASSRSVRSTRWPISEAR